MTEISLFGSQDANSTFQHFLKELKDEINGKSNDFILNVNVDEWKNYFINKYDFLPLQVYPEQATVEFKGKGKARTERYGVRYETDTYIFELKVPYTGYFFLFMLKPSTCAINHPRVDVPATDSGFVTATFTLYEQNERQFEVEKNHLLKAISINIPNINYDLERFKADVIRTFDITYQAKQKNVLSENQFFENIKININKATDKIFKVPIAEKRVIPEPMVDKKTSRKFIETPSMDDTFYNDILEVIYTFFKSVEKKPSTYQSMDEEGLRDYILPTLETRYNNMTITGETFNKGGRTDILVRYKDGTNLFVAECKFWKGELTLSRAINQLFDKYLTWRDSKVAIIIFVKNKEFSKVLKTILYFVPTHEYYIRECGGHGESSYSYVFHFPKDKGKYVYAEIMAFHFPEI